MDRFGRVPVIAGGFGIGSLACALTALGCLVDNALLVILGFVGVGAMNGGVLLARAAAADMYPPEKRARAISYVLFGALFGAALGPLVFRPLFAGKDLELETLVVPWFAASAIALIGVAIALLIRPDPRTIALELHLADENDPEGGRAGRSASRDSPAAGRPHGSDRGALELRGDGRRDEPDGLHRRRPRPRAGRRVHGHQPPHRRDVRARARHRRAHRPVRPARSRS